MLCCREVTRVVGTSMGVKRGRIVEDTTPSVRDARIRRVRLDTGKQVYLPLDVLRRLIERHSPTDEFFFVERGILGRTAWAGTASDLRQAVADGEVERRELGRAADDVFIAPWSVELSSDQGWADVDSVYAHDDVESRLSRYRTIFEKNGRHDEAETFTRQAWIATGERDGCCMQSHEVDAHGLVWCLLDSGHGGQHEPECPECWLVSFIEEKVADKVMHQPVARPTRSGSIRDALGLATPTTASDWLRAECDLAAGGYPQVARFIRLLSQLDDPRIAMIEQRVTGNSEFRSVGQRVLLETIDEQTAPGLAEGAAAAIGGRGRFGTFTPELRSSSLVAATALGIKDRLSADEWYTVTGPFLDHIPFVKLWSPEADEPVEFRSPNAREAESRMRQDAASILDAIGRGETYN